MKTREILKIAGLGLAAVLIASFALLGLVVFDVISYTATDSQKLNPTVTAVGKALVVYDPGISGQAKDAAETIAKDLQKKGYITDLAGINSEEAKNISEYNFIVVGGPIYAGKASASVKSYLNNLNPPDNAKVAVFATGQDADILNSPEMLKKEVIPLSNDNSFQIVAVTKFIENEDFNKKSAEFVDSILK
jgi:flavodoxin